jgi:hypothetical protein
MGLLDDAIREHLDLKRRRGADPGEIERAEREALGPVRRGPEPGEPVVEGSPESLAYDHEAEQQWEQPFEGGGDEHSFAPAAEDDPFAAAEPPEYEERVMHEEPPAYAEPPLHEEPPLREVPPPPADFDRDDQRPADDDPFAEPQDVAPPPHAAPASPPPASHLAEETAEYDVEAKLEEEDRDQHADDMLEETPEFLQDTPDHDRLWFEQRPPRDFDFDG